MSNYNKATNFAVKDTLTSGDPDKVVSGAEIDNEFNSIASAVTSKADKVAAATTDNLAALDANGNLKDSGENKESVVAIAAPVGSVVMHAAASAPSGWLECDGSNVSRSTYSDLFSAIGTNFGVGDGSTTFGLPDMRGEFVRGWDNGRGVDAGRGFGTAQSDAFQNHRHSTQVPSGAGNNFTPPPFDGPSGSISVESTPPEQVDNFSTPRVADETRPRNIALMYIIKT